MSLSPAQERWLHVWGSRRPSTRLSLRASRGAPAPEALRDRLRALVGRHDILEDKLGLSDRGAPEGGAIDLGAGLPVRCWYEAGAGGPVLTIEAPSGLLDASSALRLAEDLLGEAPAGSTRYEEIAAWWRETLALRREDGVTRWDDLTEISLSPPPLPWGSPSTGADFTPRFDLLALPPELRAAVEDRSARLGVAAADLLCAAWLVFCARWMDAEISILGDTHAGRTMEELSQVVGPLERILPLRVSYDPNLSFERIVRAVSAERAAAAAYQDYYVLPRGSACPSVSFAHREARLSSGRVTALSSVIEPFAMQLTVCAEPDAWLVHVGTDAALLSDADAAPIGPSFLALLGALVRDPTTPVGEPPLDAIESPPAVREATWPSAPADREIAARLAARTRQSPDRLAVFDGDRALTYAELEREVDRLAGALTALGVRPGEAVALRTSTGTPGIVGLLSILLAGAAYVPIDPSLPDARARLVLTDSGARFALVHDAASAPWIRVEPITPAPSGPCEVGRERAAYVLYTSGSTGRPRGVVVPHRAIVALVDALGPPIYDQLPEGLRVAQLASLSFDASVQQIFGALLRGHTLVPIDAELKRDPARLASFLERHRIDVVDGTPSLFELLLQYAPDRLGDLHVRQWILGGEALSHGALERYYALPGARDARIANVYGLTECGVDSTIMCVNASWTCPLRRDVPVGAAMDHAEVLLLDPWGRRVPRGAVGEICVGGPGLAIGYLNDEEETSRRFGPHPYRAGERLFRTGDRGHFDADGLLHFAGRRDEQVKLRGHRVDLGEVRHALLSHPLVEQAAVTTYAPLDGRAELAAFVVGSRLPAVREIRSHLREHLSEPMIPRHLLRVDALPLTLSGKLDRAALLAKIAREQRAPDLAGGAEAVITHVFRQVLGDARFERGDDFFAAGGNSLLALQAATGISRALGVNLELRAVYRHGTPESLALALARGDASGERVVALRPPRRSALDVFFLPPALGAAQIFAPLAHLLPEACNPWGVDYGLDGRPLEGSIPDLGAGLLGEVLGRAGGRTLVLVGYSIGAAVSFELARMLESRGRAPKLVLIDSMPGQRAGVADAAPDRAGRMAEMARSYEIRGAVACDVVALEAADKTSPLGMEGWRAHARGRFRHITIDGDHDTLLAPARLPALSVVIQRAIAFLVPAADRKFADDAKESPC